MRQVVQDPSTGRLEVVEVPDPALGPNEVLVRNAWSLISPGTDAARSRLAKKSLLGKARERPDEARRVIEKALRDGPVPAFRAVRARLDDPLTPGYSTAGVIEEFGAEVDDLAVGQQVACVGADVACHAERIAVPAALCIPLPDGLDPKWGAWAALGGVAAHAVRLSGVDAGSTVLVIGLGLVGQLIAQFVTAAGGRCVAVDRLEERVNLATELGAKAGVVSDEAAIELVSALTSGEGADAVIIAAATPDDGPLKLGARAARDRAAITVVGDAGVGVPRKEFYEKELSLRISRSYGPGRYDPSYELEGREYPIGYVRWTQRRTIRHFLEQVEEGQLRLAPLVTHEIPIERAEEAYAVLSEQARLGILLRYPTGARPTAGRVRVAASSARSADGSGRPRVALLGPGLFGRTTLLPLLRKMDIDLVSVAGGSPVRSFATARRWGAGAAATDPSEAVRDPSVDVVMIATRHDSHADLATCALNSGKSVFLEKPLAVDADGFERVRAALPGGRLVVDFNRSVAPATTRVRQHFDGRRDPVAVECRVNAGYLAADHWLRDPAIGGGRVVGEGCHFVDLCSTLVGHPLASVAATSLPAAGRTLAGDSFVLTLRYRDGSVATMTYVSSGPRRLRKERVEVIGAGRAAVIDDFRAVALYSSTRTSRLGGIRGQDKGHRAMLESAFGYFRGSDEPPIPYERLFETTQATFTAREAIHRGVRSEVALSDP